MKLIDKIDISTSCEPSFYTTYDDLNNVNIGDIITVKFKDKNKVKPKYKGKSIQFLVNNYMDHNWRRQTRRLALIPLDKINLEDTSFKNKGIIILDDSDRFDCLMIDLFDENKIEKLI